MIKRFLRSPTPADHAYNQSMQKTRVLQNNKHRSPAQETELNQLLATNGNKAAAVHTANQNSDSDILRQFVSKLRANSEVRQTFDPWEIDKETRDKIAATDNSMKAGIEFVHRHHLHITIVDEELCNV